MDMELDEARHGFGKMGFGYVPLLFFVCLLASSPACPIDRQLTD
jgi:hypothetical protein